MRCEEHGLTAGPGGQCVVCLRDARESAQRRARWLSLGFVLAVLATCGALLAARSLHAVDVALRPAPVAQLRAEPTLEPVPPTASSPPARQDPAVVASSASNEASAEPTPPAAAVSASASGALAAPATNAPQPTREQLQAAFRATPVLMFSTTWCPVCAHARQFFQANGLAFVDHDVDKDPAANAELKRRSGGKAIPLLEIDGQQLPVGFSEDTTARAVAASVERRLGITGVRFATESVTN